MPSPTREDLIEMIAYALWRSLDLRRSLDDARLWARKVVEHLELCQIEWRPKPATRPHKTP